MNLTQFDLSLRKVLASFNKGYEGGIELVLNTWRYINLIFFYLSAKMNVQKTNKPAEPQLCKTCNKFWGTEAHQGLCSKCYGAKNKTDPNVMKKDPKQEKATKVEKQQEIVPAKGAQENKQRCFSCQRKLGLLGVQCKCGYVYCKMHRLPQDHECTINYEEKGKEKLKKEIIKIQHEKVREF